MHKKLLFGALSPMDPPISFEVTAPLKLKPSFSKEVLIEKYLPFGKVEMMDNVIAEERVEFYLNGKKLLSVMCVPSDQDAHLVGFLISEGVLSSADQIVSLSVAQDGLSVHLEADINEANLENLFKEKTLTSGCCVGVTANVDGSIDCNFVDSNYSIKSRDLLDLIEDFSRESELFSETGCVHKATLVLENGIKITAEDIGRHNAIDKAVGKAKLARLDTSRAVLLASGRLSMEMVIKCAMHRIPIVASKAAVTMMGIRSAQEYGITLAGFARGKKMNLYTHAGRIII